MRSSIYSMVGVLSLSCLGLASGATPAWASIDLDECPKFAERFFPGEPFVCGPQTIQFSVRPESRKAEAKKKIRIAGFNILHIGNGKDARFKDYDLLAQVVNQWDVIGVLETQDTPDEEQTHNAQIDELVSQAKEAGDDKLVEELHKEYIKPGFIKLLLALREYDPSWALVMGTEATGDSSYVEHGAQYYRSSQVKPKAIDYCHGESACEMKFTTKQNLAISRKPLIASYQAGKFDFVVASTHIRFRFPKGADSKKAVLEVIPAETGPFKASDSGLQMQSRFAEVAVILDSMGKIGEKIGDRDVILVGDFNIEPDEKKGAWEYALKQLDGAQLFQTGATSLSTTQGLANSYDHFIFNPSEVAECNGQSAAPFDFTDKDTMGDDVYGLSYYLTDDYLTERAATIEAELKSLHKVQRGKLVPRYTAAEIKAAVADYNTKIVKAKAATINTRFYGLLSDHIPISMECSTADRD